MTGGVAPLSFSSRGILGSIAVLVVIVVCIRLGFWQLDRREERRARNTALIERGDAPPVRLDPELRDTAGLRYRLASAEGHWDGERSIVLPGRSYRGSPGAYVLTPLVLEGGRAAVLVNRGWAPAADAASVDTTLFDVAGRDTVGGLLVGFPGQEASLAGRTSERAQARPGAFRRVWFAIDEAALRAQFPYALLPITLQPLPAPEAPRLPARLERPALEEGPHLGYAIQWFSFALIALLGWLALVVRSRRS
jgi:surfeit locus 1 family protein